MATRNCIYCNTKFTTAQSDNGKMAVECYTCFLNRVNEVRNVTIGQTVKVTSLAGVEYGILDSVNTKLGKADVWFEAGQHFCSFNLNQIEVA